MRIKSPSPELSQEEGKFSPVKSLEKLKSEWEGHGSADPLWAILTDSRQKGGRWDVKDFFSTGVKEITIVLKLLNTKGIRPRFKGKALDFGCGVGRLTQALGRRFASAEGVDISQAMIEGALRYNRLGKRVRYHVNTSEHLPILKDASFDFVYTSIVLQHIPPLYSEVYLREFLRVLKPGGLLVFQLPFARRVPLKVLWRYKLRLRTRLKKLLQDLGIANFKGFDPHPIDMHAIPEARVRSLMQACGGEVLDVVATNSTNESFHQGLRFYKEAPVDDWYPSVMYIVRRLS